MSVWQGKSWLIARYFIIIISKIGWIRIMELALIADSYCHDMTTEAISFYSTI